MSDQVFQVIERYILGSPIASGGMATVYLGRPTNLPRVVAVKQLRPEMAHDQTFVRMFLDEAQLLCRIRHKNVAPPIDCFHRAGEFFIVMEYVHGQSLSQLLKGERVTPGLAGKIMSDVLIGLDAAHDAVDCSGQPLGLVHRDVSPHNILVGTDGAARIVDFGIAKAAWRAHVTQHGQLKGKPGYMAPEQLRMGRVDRRTDVYAAGIVLWELLAGKRLLGDAPFHQVALVSEAREIPCPSAIARDVPRALDEVVLRALARDPDERFPDARSMAEALLDAAPHVRDFEVAAWVTARAHEELKQREELVFELENLRLSEATAGQFETPATLTNEVADRERRPVRMGYVVGAGAVVTIVAVGVALTVRSRHPLTDKREREVSALSTIDEGARAAVDQEPPTEPAAAGAPISPLALSSATPSIDTAPHPAAPPFDSKGPRRKQEPVSAPSNVPAREVLPRSYDPLRDDRRR